MIKMKIKEHMIGIGQPTYIIAEMSANHAGSIERAKAIIHAAKEAGADCVKIQTYTADTLTIDCDNEYFQIVQGTWKGENLYHLYGKAYTPWEWQKELKEEADKIGIDFFSTPFDKTSVDFLESIGVEFYKIASFELIDLPLIAYVASKGKPMILSTGMATLEEIKEAVETIKIQGNENYALLKCSSAYPAVSEDMNLATIGDMIQKFKVPIGLSDHSMGSLGATTAVALGASIIEKHFCISREIDNPDASFSMTPDEFKSMVEDIRNVEKAKGAISYGVSKQEANSLIFRRSIFIVKDIRKGEIFTQDNLAIIRPGYGEKPKYLSDINGMISDEDCEKGQPFNFSKVKKDSILFLTNSNNTDALFAWLQKEEPQVYRIENKLTIEMIRELQPKFMISFNYKHIVCKEIIEYMDGLIINLHTSYLPYNRGSAPNFFSFYYNTPKGVTIHLLDEGLDTGKILCQEEVKFVEEKETFASTYDELIRRMTSLFQRKWSLIIKGQIGAKEQVGIGSYHTMKELKDIRNQNHFEWDVSIQEYKEQNKLS